MPREEASLALKEIVPMHLPQAVDVEDEVMCTLGVRAIVCDAHSRLTAYCGRVNVKLAFRPRR